jgi:sugar lactone lactonase YvrE
MYLVDSGPGVVNAFDFDDHHGSISNRRVLVTVPEEIGTPDGMTVDAGGDLWVAIYGGGRVNRYSPDGRLLQVLTVPAEQCTCCAFGGPTFSRLYVTTATEFWDDERRRLEPAAGIVYRFDTDALGQASHPFRPQGEWWLDVNGER